MANLPPPALTIQPGQDYPRPKRVALPLVQDRVHFRHPGYSAPFNKLFSLWRVESVSNGEQWGVHFTTALTACQIIANNAFDGYLAEDADGARRIDVQSDHVLTQNEYFFIVPNKPMYAIVPSSKSGNSQPLSLRPGSRLGPNATPSAASNRCVVTGRFTVEMAHLSPREAQQWFINNGMAQYDPTPPSDVDSSNNTISLDCSLHAAMDKRMWTFAPRHGRFAVQTISLPKDLRYEHLCEFVHEYHGRHMMDQSRVEFLFARFAWTVLLLVKTFLLMPRPSTLLARHRVWDDGELRQEEDDMPHKDINSLFGGGGSRNASPRPPKRSRTGSEQRPQDLDYERELSGTSDAGDDCDDDGARGRKRQRLNSRERSPAECERRAKRVWGDWPPAERNPQVRHDWGVRQWSFAVQPGKRNWGERSSYQEPAGERDWGDQTWCDQAEREWGDQTHLEEEDVEDRGRTTTRDEENFMVKRTQHTSNASPSGSIPSLADTGTFSGRSVSAAPSPQAYEVQSRPKDDTGGNDEDLPPLQLGHGSQGRET